MPPIPWSVCITCCPVGVCVRSHCARLFHERWSLNQDLTSPDNSGSVWFCVDLSETHVRSCAELSRGNKSITKNTQNGFPVRILAALDFHICSVIYLPIQMTHAWFDSPQWCLLADFILDTLSHLSRMHIKDLPEAFPQLSLGKLHLIGTVMAELDRKIWEGGLMATRCVNSLGPRRSVSIHLGFLCHLQASRMHAAEPRVWKTGWASPLRSCPAGGKE